MPFNCFKIACVCLLIMPMADKAAAQVVVGLWEPYRPERCSYEIVECGRRIADGWV